MRGAAGLHWHYSYASINLDTRPQPGHRATDSAAKTDEKSKKGENRSLRERTIFHKGVIEAGTTKGTEEKGKGKGRVSRVSAGGKLESPVAPLPPPFKSFAESKMSEDEWVSSVTRYAGSPMTPEARKQLLGSMPAEDQNRYTEAVRKRHLEMRRLLQTATSPGRRAAGEKPFGLRDVVMMSTPRRLQPSGDSDGHEEHGDGRAR